ncbi:helix-turn-helix domain-containing protein [Prauserella muralis]|uniref:Uncharacterized protein n=1 Tax=Prauserella muralis TaxID=588067 RepID=A0A2V4AYC4_9PSEU|nr:helix-turn-helix transcriptional regulator [Prauserella muralis]PXY26914.1 hypothetical protein BAY60_10440 [Prauserella muralis]TWE23476.1 helix-turn-helix protein [Prauserella muralis]
MGRPRRQGEPDELSRRLRQLRLDRRLTQPALAGALGVAVSSVSSWENGAKVPPPARLADYAAFFATPRTAGTARLIGVADLTEDERLEYHRLKNELERLHGVQGTGAGEPQSGFWHFPDDGPVRILCGKLPRDDRAPFASGTNHNYMALSAYADLDSMVELFGHVRAANPGADVGYELAPRLESDDLQAHLVVLGSAAINQSVWLLAQQLELPVRQVEDPDVGDGEVFELTGDARRRFRPQFGADGRLLEDVGLLARVPNPHNVSRTLTICSGVFTRGVYGAVRTLTDDNARGHNFEYVQAHFASTTNFGLLIRVPVLDHATPTPDLRSPHTRLQEWPELL